MSRKEQLEKEKNAILSKDVATKNPIFEAGQITELFNMFSLYADPRNKKTDIRDVLVTARTLGLHEKYHLVFNALEQIADARKGDPIDFETFLKDLTAKLVPQLTYVRAPHTPKKVVLLPSLCLTFRARTSWTWMTCDI